MQRKFLRDSLICLIPILLAALIVGQAFRKYQRDEGGFKLGVDLVGGTILVYETDEVLTRQMHQGQGQDPNAPPNDAASAQDKVDMAEVAAALKRRIDPADLKNVTIRPVGGSRVEIILPTGGASHGTDRKRDVSLEEVEAIKNLIRQVGNLEFRIVANPHDDRPAIEAAKNLLAGPDNQDLVRRLGNEGQPPPPPVPPEGDVFNALGDPATYSWVELGKQERHQLRLSNEYEDPAAVEQRIRERNPNLPEDQVRLAVAEQRANWERLAAARARSEAVELPAGNPAFLLYSRPCTSRRISEAERNEKKYEYFMLTRASDSVKVGGNVTVTARVQTGSNFRPAVSFTFNSEGARQFYNVTFKNRPTGDPEKITRQLAIILDGLMMSAPNIQSAISDNGEITGDYTSEEANQLVNILRSGALRATLKPVPVSENTIGPTLGADTVKWGTISVLLAFVAVLVFMIVYYRFAGLVASIALLANLLLTVGFMVAVNATFTLPGLAGLVLMLGMAVDANVLIYERLREERDRGASLAMAIRNGYDRAFPTIIDTHLSSIFTAIVLYAVGNDQLKGFGVSLTAGLIISLFTSLFMTRLMFDYWLARGWLSKLRMMRLFSRPNIDFMRIRHYMITATVILTVVGVSVFLLRGKAALNVDFVGGTAYGGQLKHNPDPEVPESQQGMTITELRNQIDKQSQEARLAGATVEPFPDPTGKFRYSYRIRFPDGTVYPVALANAPAGNSEEEQLADVKRRVSSLPDWSVEQVFLSTSGADRSRFFTVRTTEREPQLVSVMIDRLFRTPDGGSLLAVTTVEPKQLNPETWELTFSDYTSPSYAKTLLDRMALRTDLPSTDEVFDLRGEGEDNQGRFKKMTVSLLRSPLGAKMLVSGETRTPEEVKKDTAWVDRVLAETCQVFDQSPQPERLETFDGTLAAETRTRALYAILASWVAILLYLWFRFGNWTFGLAAVLCLVHDLCFTLGAIAFCHYVHDTTWATWLGLHDFKIDLPAVAALLTLVGYSVNDTIVVFDRIREVRGKNPHLTPQMINDSVNQTLSRTILASLTTFLVVVVLYFFGGEGVHLFAFVMVVGVIVGTYSSIYIASPLLLIFGEGRTTRAGTPARAPEPTPAGSPRLVPAE